MTIREIIDSGQKTVSINDAAEIAEVAPATLRQMIQQGTCPFGMYTAGRGARKFFCIPALAFVNWMTGSHYMDLDHLKITDA